MRSKEIAFEVQKALFTYNFYWSVIQCVGLYVIKLMSGLNKFKEVLSLKDLSLRPVKSVIWLIALVLLTLGILWASAISMGYLYYGSWSRYLEVWGRLVKELPLFSKYIL